jgi:hypothetical protein
MEQSRLQEQGSTTQGPGKLRDRAMRNEVYIDFMNKDNGFKTERKYFKTYNDAHEWAINNFEKFNHDMISYTEYEKPIKN